jgi:protein-S-isoprenylcysteine O-methyltransferase Ste14
VRNWTGLLITFFSLCFTIWARINLGKNWSGRVTLKEDHELITKGAYAITRNPIYTGILFAFLGDAIRLGVWRGFAGMLILFIALLIKIRREEALLSGHFGEEYANYKKRVKALIPFLW